MIDPTKNHAIVIFRQTEHKNKVYNYSVYSNWVESSVRFPSFCVII